MPPKRVIIDVDVGIDDYLALLIFFHAEKEKHIKIEAIICSMGNTSLENVCNNVIRLLENINRPDIPVYKGVTQSLIPIKADPRKAHGSDGFGDLKYSKKPDLSLIKKEPACVALGNFILNNPDEIYVICLGPLTNLALTIRLFEDFVHKVKEIWVMGGNFKAVGNATAAAEYNFFIDPEAAHIVLDSVKKPLFMLTWETSLEPKIYLDWRSKVFRAKKSLVFDLLVEADEKMFKERGRMLLMCDAFLAGAFIKPEIITKKFHCEASVELHGSQTRGQVVVDHLRRNPQNNYVTIIEEIDRELFKEILEKLQI